MVWLRLHNNTTCGILVYTGFVDYLNAEYARYFRVQALLLDNGVTKYTHTFDPPAEGAPLPVRYSIVDWKHQGSSRPGNYPENTNVWPQEMLRGGKSVLFAVRQEYIKKGLGISVSFQYEWEQGQSGEVLHRVVFDPIVLKVEKVKE